MALAIDTNILVRFLTGDDFAQAEMAGDQMRRGFILTATVLMETEWVLRAAYGWPRETIARALANIADMPEAQGLPYAMNWLLERFAAGADMADMIHLSTAAQADAFLTFDRRIEQAAGAASPVAVITLGTER